VNDSKEKHMFIPRAFILTGIALAAFLAAGPASALTMAECSTKYNAAKEAGTLNGQTWNEFRKAECAANAAVGTETSAPSKKAKKATSSEATAEPAKGLTMKECSAKYNAAKEAGTLNGLTWNQFRKAQCTAAASETATAKKSTSSEAAAEPAKGLTMKECSAKYNAAKEAGTLNGLTWNQFRKAQCTAAASETATAKKPSATAAAQPAKGLTMKECSAKYGAAKDAGKLGGMTWNQFRKAQCGANAAEDDTVPYIGQATYSGEPDSPQIAAPRGVKFPNAIARKFSDETPGKARLHTCLEQYYANKDSDSLGGLRWIQKGGGYYSLCNAKLKANLAG
jgi:hypothetical protein